MEEFVYFKHKDTHIYLWQQPTAFISFHHRLKYIKYFRKQQ